MSKATAASKTLAALVIIAGLAAVIGGVVWLHRDQSVSPPSAAPATLEPVPGSLPSDVANAGVRHEFKLYPKVGVLADTTALGYVGDNGRGWVEALAADMCWSVAAKSAELETGYTNPGGKPNTSAFADRADDVAADRPSIVVVQGGLHDYRATPDQLREAALKVFTTLKDQLPSDAMIIAVGPVAGDVATPEDVARVSGPIAAAAAEKGVVWIDPMVEGWLPDPSYFSNDGLLPNGRGQIEYAKRFAADLRAIGAPTGC